MKNSVTEHIRVQKLAAESHQLLMKNFGNNTEHIHPGLDRALYVDLLRAKESLERVLAGPGRTPVPYWLEEFASTYLRQALEAFKLAQIHGTALYHDGDIFVRLEAQVNSLKNVGV